MSANTSRENHSQRPWSPTSASKLSTSKSKPGELASAKATSATHQSSPSFPSSSSVQDPTQAPEPGSPPVSELLNGIGAWAHPHAPTSSRANNSAIGGNPTWGHPQGPRSGGVLKSSSIHDHPRKGHHASQPMSHAPSSQKDERGFTPMQRFRTENRSDQPFKTVGTDATDGKTNSIDIDEDHE